MKTEKSEALFSEAKGLIPGGVNSPVRAFRSVDSFPRFMDHGAGCTLTDADGNNYTDYVCSFGPLILGHTHPDVVRAVTETCVRGMTYGAPCEEEVKLARLVTEAIPSVEKVRMVNSGTEATMSAVRLARAFTGRDKIIKFEGCYHGHGDSFLVKAGSGMLTESIAASPGVPASVLAHTVVCRYNDIDSVQEVFRTYKGEIAAVITEPVPANMGLVLPEDGFLQALRDITKAEGALLIFDEVITGFRACYGGYQNVCGITPDLTTLGKIIGGGLPVGAYGGRRDIMEKVAPEGAVYQAGTLSGNPLAMAAGCATLEALKRDPALYETLEQKTRLLCEQAKQAADEVHIPVVINRLASLFTLFFTDLPAVRSYADVMQADTGRYARFHAALMKEGIYFAPSQFEVAFVSAAHGDEDIKHTVNAIRGGMQYVQQTS